MKLFIRLFVGLFLVQLALLSSFAISRADYPVVDSLITPAYFLGMTISIGELPGFLSVLFGITVTSVLYALLVWAFFIFVSKVLHTNRLKKRGAI